MQLNYRSILGTVILCVLSKDYFSINMNSKKKEYRLDGFKDEIVFTSTLNTMFYKGHSLSPDKIIAINRYLEDLFIEDLYRYCKDNIKMRDWRPGIEQAICNFCDIHGIEIDTDITLDALKKAEYRYRIKQKENSQTFVLPQNKPMQSAFFLQF